MQQTGHNLSRAVIITLPPERWREAKQLRLAALLAEPTAFASSHADESAFGDDVWLARLKSPYRRESNMAFYAELDGTLVGMAGANWSPREKLPHVATVYGVYVAADLRGRGIASRLMKALLDELCRLPQIEKVSLTVNTHCPSAIRLYTRMGLDIVGTLTREFLVDGRYFDLHVMERHLSQP